MMPHIAKTYPAGTKKTGKLSEIEAVVCPFMGRIFANEFTVRVSKSAATVTSCLSRSPVHDFICALFATVAICSFLRVYSLSCLGGITPKGSGRIDAHAVLQSLSPPLRLPH